ncbi:DNA cytosine methyltransferase [Aeromonas caviae]|uniref:DNA (cytosine-5-)-methyltransferase n=2 Tax=Aeromonas caviae TaxID=648 RepID=A0AA42UI57_AERCA|nr:DNA cytosine methyltransferase [Aeromonas caviae]MDH0477387.1 DNA cytosine methyltransferase [Aeromonas caviae]MDH1506499.1 DNA cytosine methyltransferase [Aeromonas caviae]MDH1807329.1 DNA cytosine methyltransferase [Aeromonas caviae]
MGIVIATKLGENKGLPRVWCEGRKLAREGIEVGMKYQLNFNQETGQVKVNFGHDLPSANGTVSRRKVRGTVDEYLPLIDMNDQEFLKLFDTSDAIRIAIRGLKMTITAQTCVTDADERADALHTKLMNGKPLTVCSLFHGGGVLDNAIHSGLARAGVKSYVKVAVELESKYLESSLKNNPDMFKDDSVLFEGSIEHFNPRNGTKVDLLIAGIPCTGASLSGRAKNKLAHAEEHEGAGALFYYFLNAVVALNPAVCVIENVEPYANTASMAVIRSVLSSRGYTLEETILDASDFGCLEKRRRLCVVAHTGNSMIGDVLTNLVSTSVRPANVGEILENIPGDDPRWKSFDYLVEKEIADKAAGKGFARQLITRESESYGTIGRLYAKCRSTEPFLQHDTDPALSRLLTPVEHARGKGVPVSLIDGLSDTTAHEILGQGVAWTPFEAVGFAVGRHLIAALYPEAHDPEELNNVELNQGIPALVDLLCANHNPHHPCLVAA